MLNHLKIFSKLAICFSAMIVTVLIVSGVIYSGRLTLAENSASTKHTYAVMEEIAAVLASLVDQETGIRGYLITANSNNLAPYESGRKAFDEHFIKVKTLTADNPAQQARLDQIKQAADQWGQKVAQPALKLMRDPQTRDQAQKIERDGIGKGFF